MPLLLVTLLGEALAGGACRFALALAIAELIALAVSVPPDPVVVALSAAGFPLAYALLAPLRLRPDPVPGAPDLADLRGQPHLRHALEVAAAGGHSLLMVGPPGAGKSLAASRLPSILPPLSETEALEVARVAGATGRPGGLSAGRPFRAPHHTISAAGLIGGGAPPRPGEITLAHRGVLFLDELCEFRRKVLEALRAPLEAGEVSIVRASGRRHLPCRFMLVAASNPCPCGRGEEDPDCTCLLRRSSASRGS